MKDDHDIEDILRNNDLHPSARVKQRVLSEFKRAAGSDSASVVPMSFWRRPVPLYAAVASMVVLVALSFVAGTKSARPDKLPIATQELTPPAEIKSAQDIAWHVTERDNL